MEEQYSAGRTKAIGVSNFSIKKLERLLSNCKVKPQNNQVEMHVLLQQKPLVEFCKKHGITIVAYAPLGSRGYNNMLTQIGKEKKVLPDMLNNKTVLAVAKKHNKTAAQILLRFLLQLGVSPIPKSVTPARVKENFDVFNFSLDKTDMEQLSALDIGEDGRVCDFKAFGR